MNCHHNVAQLRRLRQYFPDSLAIIGVHSAKFAQERATESLRQAVMRHDIAHPVVNDAEFGVWNQYAVRAWPTVVLVTPGGRIALTRSGEIDADDLAPHIAQLVEDADEDGTLVRGLLPEALDADAEPDRVLRFPSRVLADPAGGRLFVADTGHHRVLELKLDARLVDGPGRGNGAALESLGGSGHEDVPSADVTRVFGNGSPSLRDGPAAEAAFHGPRGMALSGGGDTLYVADTDNHAIRAIDLETGVVRTVAGTGRKGAGERTRTGPLETDLRSPWAVLAPPGTHALFIAMAGSHQIWMLLDEVRLGPFAGTGAEALVDGPRGEACFNQPSDLALMAGHLLVADSEASAVRAIRIDDAPTVFTLVGQGLFEFGDVDGVGAAVRLQHPTGLAAGDRFVTIADTYNHRIKRLDPATGRVDSWLGTGLPGNADGPAGIGALSEPEGVALAGPWVFVADTNNHAVRVAELATGMLRTLRVRGL